MSTGAWVAIGVLAGSAVALAAALRSVHARLARAEARLDALRARLDDEIAPGIAAARGDARAAAALARRAAGDVDPPPRLALEPVTGRLVRAVALGAGARRAFGRLARRDLERRVS